MGYRFYRASGKRRPRDCLWEEGLHLRVFGKHGGGDDVDERQGFLGGRRGRGTQQHVGEERDKSGNGFEDYRQNTEGKGDKGETGETEDVT